MTNDKFGYKFLYPSKEGGWFYQQSPDITDDAEFHAEGVSNSSGNQWTLTTSGPTSPDIAKHPQIFSGNAIGGCGMNFSDTEARGYAYKSDDPRDIEFKMAVKFRSSSSDNGFSISCTSGSHSGSGCCSGFSYMCTLEYNQDPTPFRFRKEMWHVSYHTDPKTGEWTHEDFDFKFMGHGWLGLCFVRYNNKDGISSGHDSVVIEMWGNPDPDNDPQNWILMKKTEDKGGWGNDGSKCNGDSDQVGSWACAKFRIKSNDSHGVFDIKNVSIREIDPTKDIGDTPDSPEEPDQPSSSTSTILGSFTFKRNINLTRTSACAPSGFSAFYDNITFAETDGRQQLSNTATYDSTTRVGQRIRNSSSALYGQVIKQFDVRLKKVGTPDDGNLIVARIRDSDDHLKYTSATTFMPDTDLTGGFQVKTFDFSDNTYQMQIGDRVFVNWNEADDNNYVVVAIRDTDHIVEGGLSVYNNDTNSWSNKSVDLCCTLYS